MMTHPKRPRDPNQPGKSNSRPELVIGPAPARGAAVAAHGPGAPRLKQRPPEATLQSLPATPWYRARIWEGLKYAVWRLPAFAASCHRARPPADRSADPMTRSRLR